MYDYLVAGFPFVLNSAILLGFGYLFYLESFARFSKLNESITRIESYNAAVQDRFTYLDGVLKELLDKSNYLHESIFAEHQKLQNALQEFRQPIAEIPVIHQTVAAFENNLATQVRLSREDYEELMTTAESKNAQFADQLNDLRLALSTVQAQVADFRNKFDAFIE